MSDLLEYKGFLGSIGFSAEDNSLIGEVLFIEGKIVYSGSSVDEVVEAFQDAVNDYLEMCAELAIDPQKPLKGSFNVRVSPGLHRQAAIEARKLNISLNSFVASAIEDKVQPKREVHHHSHMHIHEENTFGSQFYSEQDVSSSLWGSDLNLIPQGRSKEHVTRSTH